MARKIEQNAFGRLLRDRRRKLELTQQEVARLIKTSTPYIGHLEAGKRHPSEKTVIRLAEVLGLDRRELFFLANPSALELVRDEKALGHRSAWEAFRRDEKLRRVHNVTGPEMELLQHVTEMGEVSSPRDFVYILHTVRHALGR
jgi:transcriptional regulator with XRE-family HTH domain